MRKRYEEKGAKNIVIFESVTGIHLRCDFPTKHGTSRGGGFFKYPV